MTISWIRFNIDRMLIKYCNEMLFCISSLVVLVVIIIVFKSLKKIKNSMENLNRRQRRSLANGTRRHNNRKNEQSSIQIIWSEKRLILKEKYLTNKGKLLLKAGVITKKDAWNRYGKNRYNVNPNAIAIKVITHKVYHIRY